MSSTPALYPVFKNAGEYHASDIASLPVHEFFKSTLPGEWRLSNFAAHKDAITVDQFVQSLLVIRRNGYGSINAYAGACQKYLKTEEGTVELDSAKSIIAMRRAQEEAGKAESTYLFSMRGTYFKKFEKGDEKRKSSALLAVPKRLRKGKAQDLNRPTLKVEEPWHALIQSAILSQFGHATELPPLSGVPEPRDDSPVKTVLYYLALESLYTAVEEGDQNALIWKESLVALSGIWNLYSNRANELFGATRTREAKDICYIPDLEVHDAKLDAIIQPLLDMAKANKSVEDILDATYTLQVERAEMRPYLDVLQTILKNVIKPLHGDETSSEADTMFVWANVFRDGLPLKTALDLSLGEQGCAATALSKSHLAPIFGTGSTPRKCDCLLKVAGQEVGNFEAKRAKASLEDVAMQRVKNMKINKSILLELEQYGLTCPPILNIHGLSASVFQIQKYQDIWIAGSACGPIVLPTKREEVPFFLEDSAFTLFNLLKYYDEYATKVREAKRRADYKRRAHQEVNIDGKEVAAMAALEWEKVVFHTPSRPQTSKAQLLETQSGSSAVDDDY
ncbi:hypothetical protein BGZ51_007203 [Haplosporangium sp. Z 767]|nr:hypothetical protein BGZ51_007203 [Haplosporangium sp. Z 767]